MDHDMDIAEISPPPNPYELTQKTMRTIAAENNANVQKTMPRFKIINRTTLESYYRQYNEYKKMNGLLSLYDVMSTDTDPKIPEDSNALSYLLYCSDLSDSGIMTFLRNLWPK